MFRASIGDALKTESIDPRLHKKSGSPYPLVTFFIYAPPPPPLFPQPLQSESWTSGRQLFIPVLSLHFSIAFSSQFT
jgi:hypothetical protein